MRATTVDSFSNGFRTLVPEDCSATRVATLTFFHRRYAEVTTADEVITYRESVREPAGDRP